MGSWDAVLFERLENLTISAQDFFFKTVQIIIVLFTILESSQ